MRRSACLLSLLIAASCASVRAQNACTSVARWSPCEIAMDLPAGTPDAYKQVELWGEFRGPAPEFRTRRLPAFAAGANKAMLRFTPDQPGEWHWRITGNVAAFDGKEGSFTAQESDAPGFFRRANIHFWMHPDTVRPHFYMGDSHDDLFTMDDAAFRALVDARAAQGFTHIGGTLLASAANAVANGGINDAYFARVDERMKQIHAKGLVVDLTLAPDAEAWKRNFATETDRERFIRMVVARYSAYNVVWLVAGSFEAPTNGRKTVKEVGLTLRKYDPYNHPGTSGARVTSSPLLGDKWVSHVVHNSPDAALGLVEHEKYALPLVNTGFAPTGATGEAFRKALWNAAMNGQWPVAKLDALNNADTKAMQVWGETMRKTRYWEMEPYFEIDGARAVALPGTEYLIYLEKPGRLSILVEKHSYDIYWIDPATGESTHEKKDWKGTEFTFDPPTKDRDWVLHLSRDGRKEGMAKSYKFESLPNLMQEPEVSPAVIPYDIVEPRPDAKPIVAGAAVPFALRLKRETKGTRRMYYLITGEVTLDGAGARVIGSGFNGQWLVPPEMLKSNDGVMNVKIEAINAAGKLYSLDLVYPVVRAK